jgi:uncharacterized protein YukE
MAMTLDSLAKLIAEGEQRWASEMQELRSTLSNIKPELESIKSSVDTFKPELDEIKSNFESWKPAMESKVGDLGLAVHELRRQVDHIAKGVGVGALGSPPAGTTPLTGTSPSVPRRRTTTPGRIGGVSYTPPFTPVTGPSKNVSMVPFTYNTVVIPDLETPKPAHVTNPPPQAEFPKFDGDNPRPWCRACEKYFRAYSVGEEYWVEYATMLFVGNAALWFQSAEDKMGKVTWQELCDTINKRFDRGQYQHLYRLSFRIY